MFYTVHLSNKQRIIMRFKKVSKSSRDGLCHIAIVEDSMADVTYFKHVLETEKVRFIPHFFQDGEAFLNGFAKRRKEVKKFPYDLVVLDLNLPRYNGFEILEEIQKQDKTKDKPIVVLTCSSNKNDITKSGKLGAAGYLCKPLNKENFFRIKHIIDNIKFVMNNGETYLFPREKLAMPQQPS